jgi:hypothetical protein
MTKCSFVLTKLYIKPNKLAVTAALSMKAIWKHLSGMKDSLTDQGFEHGRGGG